MTQRPLDDATMALIRLAAAFAAGDPPAIRECAARVIAAGAPPRAVDELILQSVLTVGWPRALVAAGIWRSASGAPPSDAGSDLDYSGHPEWTRRGEATCQTIYGDHYAKLRANVRGLHPALEAWMVTEGYGRTLSRPGLALDLRELCTVVQTAVLHTPRQLHSHLLGALRAGASIEAVDASLLAVRDFLSEDDWQEASDLWQRVRGAWEMQS